MKVNMEMVIKLTKSDETSNIKQIERAREIISNEKLKESFFLDAAKEIEDEMDCKVEILSYNLEQINDL